MPSRGEVWLASLGAGRSGEPGKNRPVLIVSVDDISVGMSDELLVVVPISSSRESSTLRPSIAPAEGVTRHSVALCRGIRAVARSRLLRRLGAVTPETLERVTKTLALILDIPTAGSVRTGE